MRFVKRLIIMSGENKGTLAIEKNGARASAKFNSFGKSVAGGTLSMLIDGQKHYHRLKGENESFLIETQTLDAIHAAVFCAEKLVMYGTNEPKRLSLMQVEELLAKKAKIVVSESEPLPEKIFSLRTQHIESADKPQLEQNSEYIQPVALNQTQIKPNQENTEYADDAISSINYYPPEFSFKEEAMPQLHPKRQYAANELPSVKCGSYLQSIRQSYCAQAQAANEAAKDFSLKSQQAPPEQPPSQKPQEASQKSQTPPSQKTQDFSQWQEPAQKPQKQPKHTQQTQKQQGLWQKAQQSAASIVQPTINEGAAERVIPLQKDLHISSREGNFYERCGDDIEKIFASSQSVKDLEGVLPGSKWVRIEYNDSGKYYVMGLIGKEYLCYGVPADYTPTPPSELKGYCWWLPLKPEKPKEKGYWIMYQSLKTGDAVLPPE